MSPLPAVRSRQLLVAGILAIFSLGLPWAQDRTSGFVPPLFQHFSGPGGEPGVHGFVFGVVTMGGTAGTVPGTQLPIRVVAALAAVLVWLAVRRSSLGLARAGLVVAVLGPVTALGGGVLPGHIVYLGALVLAAHGLGLLPGFRSGQGTGTAPDTA